MSVLNGITVLYLETLALRVFIPIVLIIFLFGCGGGSSNVVTPPPTVATVTVTPRAATILAGAQKQFSATAKDSSGNVMTGVSFTWSSGTPSVATVSTTGLATGVSQGTAQVNATANNVTGSATLTVNSAASDNAIPESFFGFTINKDCSIANNNPDGSSCDNPESHSFPGLPLAWSRSLAAGDIKWSDLVQCDPTGSVCPLPGSGCSKTGAGPNGTSCPSSELVPNCQPNVSSPDDPNNCAYIWTTFDFWTERMNAHGVNWMYDAFHTPDYLSVRGSRCVAAGQADFGADPSCVGPADICGGTTNEKQKWGCDPPFDIDATPGSGLGDGSDQNFEWFVTAFMKHLQQSGEHISYWEVWNEPNICKEWNHNDEPNVDCPTENPGGGPSTGTLTQLVRMAKDARGIIPTFDATVKISSPPIVGVSGTTGSNYMTQILSQGGSEFDLIGFHGYYSASVGGCPSACPTPEFLVREWAALLKITANAGQGTKPIIDTEFSWGTSTNVTDPDMRAAQAARSYLIQEAYYPSLVGVDWYGEDFPVVTTPNPNNNNLPDGGTGEFWASGATHVTDNCLTPDPVQGGFDCPAGLAMSQVFTWTIGATFTGPCTCSTSPNGGSCSAMVPTGVWQCSITRPNNYQALLVWDNTATTFPCSQLPTQAQAACGTTIFTIPPGYNNDWQDLDGKVTPLSGASTVNIGAKPILIEN
jgi:hypothetical protein